MKFEEEDKFFEDYFTSFNSNSILLINNIKKNTFYSKKFNEKLINFINSQKSYLNNLNINFLNYSKEFSHKMLEIAELNNQLANEEGKNASLLLNNINLKTSIKKIQEENNIININEVLINFKKKCTIFFEKYNNFIKDFNYSTNKLNNNINSLHKNYKNVLIKLKNINQNKIEKKSELIEYLLNSISILSNINRKKINHIFLNENFTENFLTLFEEQKKYKKILKNNFIKNHYNSKFDLKILTNIGSYSLKFEEEMKEIHNENILNLNSFL